MDSFFIEFRDPLFSIILLLLLIFVISFFSYWWGKYKTKENYKYLDRFLEQFQTLPNEDELHNLIRQSTLSYRSWILLAEAYRNNGEYEKAIRIYGELLKLKETQEDQKEIMFLLGKTYFKAGFLGRSRDVFLEILKHSPRLPQVLHYLLLVYEYMRDYNAALEVLEPLEALSEDIAKESLYLRVLALLHAYDVDDEVKKTEIVALYKEHKKLERMIFEYLFRVDPKLAWKEFDTACAEQIADILWQLPKEDVDFTKVQKSSFLQELYSAKGYIQEATESKIFELNLLIHLQKSDLADIEFEYVCSECKVTYPFSFHRCSSCHAIDSALLEYNIVAKKQGELFEAGNSFL